MAKRGLTEKSSARKRQPPKRLFNMVAEEAFFQALDRLAEAEIPSISRAHMLRKLVFEKAALLPKPANNGHDYKQPKIRAAV